MCQVLASTAAFASVKKQSYLSIPLVFSNNNSNNKSDSSVIEIVDSDSNSEFDANRSGSNSCISDRRSKVFNAKKNHNTTNSNNSNKNNSPNEEEDEEEEPSSLSQPSLIPSLSNAYESCKRIGSKRIHCNPECQNTTTSYNSSRDKFKLCPTSLDNEPPRCQDGDGDGDEDEVDASYTGLSMCRTTEDDAIDIEHDHHQGEDMTRYAYLVDDDDDEEDNEYADQEDNTLSHADVVDIDSVTLDDDDEEEDVDESEKLIVNNTNTKDKQIKEKAPTSVTNQPLNSTTTTTTTITTDDDPIQPGSNIDLIKKTTDINADTEKKQHSCCNCQCHNHNNRDISNNATSENKTVEQVQKKSTSENCYISKPNSQSQYFTNNNAISTAHKSDISSTEKELNQSEINGDEYAYQKIYQSEGYSSGKCFTSVKSGENAFICRGLYTLVSNVVFSIVTKKVKYKYSSGEFRG
ncbi:unnamed protein product [Trichobilharzia regenti]|nr:unnamed protein product [Trichobilharzia regenti]